MSARPPGGVVVGVDGSEDGYGALDVAARLATLADLPLIVVHAGPSLRLAAVSSLDPSGEASSTLLASAESDAEDCRLYTELHLSPMKVEWAFEIRPGDPAHVLEEAAIDLRAACIVVGRHGQGRLSRLLLGSVTHRLLKEATVPVLVVPPEQVVTDGGRWR
jgi:nucleotide-binding universal stress UspA family protein